MVAADVSAIPASAGAAIFDRVGRLLILKPTCKTVWTILGGLMEPDGETPWDACRREVREECGIEVRSGRLAATITLQPEEVAECLPVPLDLLAVPIRRRLRAASRRRWHACPEDGRRVPAIG